MKTEVREVTPKVASEMLKRNANNRKITKRHVAFLAREMVMGNWMFDGQPIRFSEGGTLLDGQHRLSAVIESQKPQKFLIIKGIESNAFKVMDTGRVRNAGDVFSIHGIPNSSLVSTTTRMIMNHFDGQNSIGKNEKASNTAVLDYYNENPSIGEYVSTSQTFYIGFDKVLSTTHIAFYRYIFAKRSVTDSDDFWRKVCFGLALEKGDPALILRKKLISDRLSKSSLPPAEKKAIIIKAWNAYRKGEKIKFLRWNRDNESFPEVI